MPAVSAAVDQNAINGLVNFKFGAFDFNKLTRFSLVADFLSKFVFTNESQSVYDHPLWGNAKNFVLADVLTDEDRDALMWLKNWRSHGGNFGLSVTGSCGAPGCRCAFFG